VHSQYSQWGSVVRHMTALNFGKSCVSCRVAPITVTLSDVEGHSPIASFLGGIFVQLCIR